MDALTRRMDRLRLMAPTAARCAVVTFNLGGDSQTSVRTVAFGHTGRIKKDVMIFSVSHRERGVWKSGESWELVKRALESMLWCSDTKAVMTWGAESLQILYPICGSKYKIIDVSTFCRALPDIYLTPCRDGCVCGGSCLLARGIISWYNG